jgi:hypothetical protein
VYTFKVQARNAIGLGAMSSEVLIRASAIPAVPSAPTTTVVSNTDVTISWSAPDNGGSVIESYTIKVRQIDGQTYSTSLANCNGSLASVLSALTCTIPIYVLQAAPFNLAWGSSVYATVHASNVVGSSADSTPGNGAVILTNPDAPFDLKNELSITDANEIGISWTKGIAEGGTPVIDYRISWDAGVGTYVTLA